MKFNKHNVCLPDGQPLIAGKTLIHESERFQSVIRLIKLCFPNRKRKDISLADLGCYEGGWSVEFAREGFQVSGIEARHINIEKCLWLADQFSLPNLIFRELDVNDISRREQYDVVYAAGLLYHLENPASFIDKLGEITNKLCVINTHFAAESIPSRFRHKLSDLTRHQGQPGRWYQEWEKGSAPEEIEALERSSYNNSRSFWLTRPALMECLRSAGFDLIFEQFDCHYSMEKGHVASRRNARGLFVAIKTG